MSAAAIAGTKIGTGYVDVQPKFGRDFQETIGRKLNEALAPAMRKAGKQAGKDIAEGASDRRSLTPVLKRFEKLGSEANAAIARGLRKRQASQNAKTIAGGLGLDEMSEFFTRARKDAERSLPLIERLSTRLRTRLRPLNADFRAVGNSVRQLAAKNLKGLGGELRQVASSFRTASRNARSSAGGFMGFDGVMARVNRSSQFFRNIWRTFRWPVLIAGVGLLLQGLSALAAGAVAATSALSSLSGLLVTLPAAALAGAQAFGAMKLATAGVGDAVKAALDAQVKGGAQAVDTMRQQEQAAEGVADAKRNLIDVEGQAEEATDALTDARKEAERQLDDLRLASERSVDSEQSSVLSLKQARQELAKALRDPASSGLDIRFAEEAVDQARHDLEETRIEAKRAREDYRDAQEKGVKGMPEVVAAKKAEADANRAVKDASRDLERAVRDQTDALKDQGSAASALQEKMSQLPPAAQKFVHFLVGMKPRLDALRETAAEGFFPGAEKGLRGALGNFKVFRGLIDGTSKALGGLAAKAGRKLGSAAWGKDLARLGKLNTRIIGRLGDSALNFGDALRHVLVAAEPFLDWLSKGTEKFSEWIEGEAKAGRESGRLAAFFDRTRETMERLGPILKGVGGALMNISEAARPLGNAILDALGDSAEGWRKWTDSTKGENTLKRYFAEVKPAVFEMGKLIGALGKAFFTLGKQEGVAHLLRLVRTELVPALTDVTGAVTGWASDFLTEFGEMRDRGVPTFDAFLRTLANHAGEAGWKIAKALVGAFINAGIWGKLAITGLILSKTGGLKKLAGLGWDMGTALGKNLFKAAAKWIAGTETGAGLLGWMQDATGPNGKLGKAAKTGGARVGKIFGASLVLGAIAGLAALQPMIADAIRKYIKEPVERAKEDIFGGGIGGAINDATNFIGKNFPATLNPGAPLVNAIFRDDEEIPAPKTDKARAGFERFRKHVVREGLLTREGFRSQLGPLPGIAEGSGRGVLRQMLPRLDTLKTQGGQKGDAFAKRVAGSFGSLTGAATTAMETLGFNVSQMLKTLGGKAPQFNLKKALGSLPELSPMGNQLKPVGRQTGGLVPAFATGGLASMVPGNSTGDRHTLSLNGTPVAKVESKEGIFVGNRNLMGALHQANEAVPRFQKGGMVDGAVQHLRRGGLLEPKLEGEGGALKKLGQSAIHKVFEGAKAFLDKQRQAGPGIGVLGTAPGQLGAVEKLAASMGLTMTSGFRPGDDGFHGINRARDFSNSTGPTPEMMQFAMAVAKRWGSRLLELIYSPLGWSIDNGRKTPAFAVPEHFNHVHVAMQKGGLLLQKLAKGGSVAAWDALSGPTWDNDELATLAHVARMASPGRMAQKAQGESSGDRKAVGRDPGGTEGLGLWQVTTGFQDARIAKYGGREAMFNPYRNAQAAKEILDEQGMGAWYAPFVGPVGRVNGDLAERMRGIVSGKAVDVAASGPEAKPTEKIPATYKGAKTGSLDLGPMPKNLDAVNKAIGKTESLARTYGQAKQNAEKEGRPGVAQAIGRNLAAIQARLQGLTQLRTRLRLAAVRKALKKRLGKALGRFGGYDQIIEGSQQSYEGAAQYAEQVVALEPQSPEISPQAKGESDKAYADRQEAAEKAYVSNFTNYVDTRERPAYGSLLERAAEWRNNILRAEKFGFGKHRPSVLASSNAWEGEAFNTRGRIEQINDFTAEVAKQIASFRKNNPKTAFPGWLKGLIGTRDRMREQLPILHMKNAQLTEAVGKAREMFFPGGKNRIKPPPLPLPGSGTLEGALKDVQGIHGLGDLHELLPSSALAPPRVAGRFGGVIWDVQTSIEELGLRIRSAANSLGGGGGGSDDGDSERSSMLEELLRQANQRTAIAERLSKTKELFDATYPVGAPFAGVFHDGGVTPGPYRRESLALVRGEERIRTPEQEVELAASIRDLAGGGSGGAPEIAFYVNGDIVQEAGDSRPPAEAVVNGQRLPFSIRGASVTGRHTPGGRAR